MMKFAAVFVMGLVGYLAFILMPPQMKESMELAIARDMGIQLEHLQGIRR